MIHVVIVVPLALRCLDLPHVEENRAFGWDESMGTANAVATGYFIWDTLDAVFCFDAVGFVLHGFACFLIYSLSFRPFVGYYSTRCLLWETSTIFLNIHWFLDKTGKTGSPQQFVNGIVLLFTFLFVRIIWGGIVSYQFFLELLKVRDEIPALLFLVYGGGNLVLQGLNYFWFYSMIIALKKRFEKEDGSKGQKERVGNGI